MDILTDMLADWTGRVALLVIVGVLALAGWAIYADMYDGRRCVDSRPAGVIVVMVGKTPVVQPQYACHAWVDDPSS